MHPKSIHPFADEWTDDYAVFAASSLRVSYGAPLRHFLADCGEEGRRPVLLTYERAVVTSHAAFALLGAGALWAVRTDDGVFDGLSGYRIRSMSDLWLESSTDRDRLASFEVLRDDSIGAFMFDAFVHQRAARETTIGMLADHMVRALGGWGLDRWGLEEPLAERWQHEPVTALVREQMPATAVLRVTGPDGSFCAIDVARTRTGLLEHVRGAVPAGPYGAPNGGAGAPLARHPGVTRALTGLAERFRPTIAMMSYVELGEVGAGLGQRVGARRVDAPLAVLLGGRAVRDLGIDVDDLARRHDVESVGSGRVRSLIVRLSDRGPFWSQLKAFVHDLNEERLAALLGAELREVL